jgi:hypothetical protein
MVGIVLMRTDQRRLEFQGARVLMLFSRHVYSSWYFRQIAAIDLAFSSPKCWASSAAIEAVDRRVP